MNNFYKTDMEYLLAPTDDLVRFWRSKIKVQGHSRPPRLKLVDCLYLSSLDETYMKCPLAATDE